MKQSPSKPRPYWHVDLKWIHGIMACFAMAAALLLWNLAVITQREQATELSATIVANLFSQGGLSELDNSANAETFREMIAQSPGEYVVPIEQFAWLRIPKEEALELTPREFVMNLSRQIVEPIYDKGLRGAAEGFTQDPAERDKFVKDAALLGVMTSENHDKIQQAAIVVTVVAIIALAGAVYFSAGWGRLVSPGVIALLVSPIGLLAGLLLRFPPPDGGSPLQTLPDAVKTAIGDALFVSYGVVWLVGVALLLAAGIGKLIQRMHTHKTIGTTHDSTKSTS